MGTGTAIVVAVIGALVAGCAATNTTAGSGTPAGSGVASATPSPPAPVSPSATQTPTATARSARPERCHTSQLAARVRLLGAAAGSRYATVILTNTSDDVCRTYGYVGLQVTGPDGDDLPTRVAREIRPAPHRVVLRPGQRAFTRIHWTVVPGDGEPVAGPCQRRPSRLLIIPPDERTQLSATWPGGPVCERGRIFVTALRPGTGQPH